MLDWGCGGKINFYGSTCFPQELLCCIDKSVALHQLITQLRGSQKETLGTGLLHDHGKKGPTNNALATP